jgi:hypothetical protein
MKFSTIYVAAHSEIQFSGMWIVLTQFGTRTLLFQDQQPSYTVNVTRPFQSAYLHNTSRWTSVMEPHIPSHDTAIKTVLYFTYVMLQMLVSFFLLYKFVTIMVCSSFSLFGDVIHHYAYIPSYLQRQRKVIKHNSFTSNPHGHYSSFTHTVKHSCYLNLTLA